MPVNILLFDPFPAHRKVVLGFLSKFRPDVIVEEYDPVKGQPSPAFDWSPYSLAIIDARTGADKGNREGLRWASEFLQADNCPPVIFLSSVNDVDTAVSAMKLGAKDYILKQGINSQRLKEVFGELLPPMPVVEDVMPALRPLPESRPVEPASQEEEIDEEYWDQQTQILYNPPKPSAS